MSAQSFGPCRSRAARKPDSICGEPVFFKCGSCGCFCHLLGPDAARTQNGPINCCGQPMELLAPIALEELPPGPELDYRIVGSLNENAVQVTWSVDPAYKPAWLYLKSFTGGMVKYLAEKKRPPAVFPLADEDAYVYCDKDPCVECTFRCKRGFILYGWFDSIGLVKLPLDRISDDLRR